MFAATMVVDWEVALPFNRNPEAVLEAVSSGPPMKNA
jgi:hypothetical protein